MSPFAALIACGCTSAPIQLAKAPSKPDPKNGPTIEDVLSNLDTVISGMESTVSEMQKSNHPNAVSATEKLEKARGMKTNLENVKKFATMKLAEEVFENIMDLRGEINVLKKEGSLNVSPPELFKSVPSSPDLPEILAALKSKDPGREDKIAALNDLTLKGTGSKEEARILKAITKDPAEDPEVNSRVSILLGKTGNYFLSNSSNWPTPGQAAALGDLLQTDDLGAWRKVLNDEGNISDERMNVILSFHIKSGGYLEAAKLLDGRDPEWVKILVIIVSEKSISDRKDVCNAFIRMAKEDQSVWVRARALYGLRLINSKYNSECFERSLGLFESELNNGSFWEKSYVIKALAETGGPRARAILNEYVSSETDTELKTLADNEMKSME